MTVREDKINWAITHGYNAITQCNKCGKITYLDFANGLKNGWGLCCGYTPTLVWHNADVAKATKQVICEQLNAKDSMEGKQ